MSMPRKARWAASVLIGVLSVAAISGCDAPIATNLTSADVTGIRTSITEYLAGMVRELITAGVL